MQLCNVFAACLNGLRYANNLVKVGIFCDIVGIDLAAVSCAKQNGGNLLLCHIKILRDVIKWALPKAIHIRKVILSYP